MDQFQVNKIMSQTDSQDLNQEIPASEENKENSSIEIEIEIQSVEQELPESDIPKGGTSKSFAELKKALEKVENDDEKLALVIEFMESTLAQKGTPHFKDFWEGRGLCLELFKKQLPPALRAIMWEKYSDLSKEARRLKEIFDEKSAFAMEQIGEAIKGVEAEIELFDEKLKAVPDIKFPAKSKTLDQNRSKYNSSQRELNLYNTFATRVTTLRKELIKTDMRIRFKNQFFSRLSSLGDKVFPRRKELIQEVSQLFISDVKGFADSAFSGGQLNAPHFAVRDEIKALQSAAKVLTLNSGSFNATRKILSECWDKLKQLDKDFKKDRAEKKEIYQKNAEPILKEIQELKESVESNKISVSEAQQKVGLIARTMRDTELGRDEVKQLQTEVGVVKNLLREQGKLEEKRLKELKEEKARKKLEMIENVRKEISKLEEQSDVETGETLASKLKEIEAQLSGSDFPRKEAGELREELVPVQDLIHAKSEAQMLSLSDEDAEALQKMRQVLSTRRERAQEIKGQVEDVRKILGGSGLDFEQSLRYNELLNRHKDRLNQLNDSIEELKSQISAHKKK